MSFNDFLARYQATEASIDAYVRTLPLWVNVWRGWMFLVFTAAIIFVVWKTEARWVMFTMIVSLFAYNLVAMGSSVGRFPSIAFVVSWSPLAFYLWQRRSHLRPHGRFDTVYSWWLTAVVVTLCVSVAFDIYNVAYSVIARVP
jgi:hypothetical protein